MVVGLGEIIGLLALLLTVLGGLTACYLDMLKHRQGKAFQRLRASLRKGSTTAMVYAWTLKRVLAKVDRFFEGKPYDPKDDSDPATRRGRFARWLFRRPSDYRRPAELRDRDWQASAWSTASYDRCLLLALIYPIAFAVLSWLIAGEAGSFGQALGLTHGTDALYRIYVSGVLGFAVGCLILGFSLGGKSGRRVRLLAAAALIVAAFFSHEVFFSNSANSVLGFAFVFIGALAITEVGIIAIPSTIALAFSGVLLFLFVAIFSNSVAFTLILFASVAVSGIIGLAIAVAFIANYSVIFSRRSIVFGSLSVLYLVSAYALVGMAVAPKAPTAFFTVVVGVLLLPLVNAPFDWLSVGLTRYLLRLGLQRQRLRDRIVCWWADIGGAALLLLGVAVAMVVALEGLNAVGFAGGMSEPIAPVAATLHDIRAEPGAARHLWIYFALFSTLIPTLVHLVVILFSALTANFPPLQGMIVRLIALGPDAGYNPLIGFLLSVRWVIAIAATALLAFCIWWIGSAVLHVWEDLLWLLIEVQKLCRALLVG